MPSLPSGPLVADASFLIGVADGDSNALRFRGILQRCVVSSVNFGEVMYMLVRKTGVPAQQVEQTFAALGVTVADLTVQHVRGWPRLKSIAAASRAAQSAAGATKIRSLSRADMACLGFAEERQLPVLTGDVHWTALHAHGLNVVVFDYRDRATTP